MLWISFRVKVNRPREAACVPKHIKMRAQQIKNVETRKGKVEFRILNFTVQ